LAVECDGDGPLDRLGQLAHDGGLVPRVNLLDIGDSRSA
jgi:hypothetical protein